jgi:hypothetical protein
MARICRDDLPDGESEIFLQMGLDSPVNKPPDEQITGLRREHISRVADAAQRHHRVHTRLDAPRLRRGALLNPGSMKLPSAWVPALSPLINIAHFAK